MDVQDAAAEARRSSWSRSSGLRLRYARPADRPPLGFAQLMAELTRGRMGTRAAQAMLEGSGDPEVVIRIDRSTGLVSNWRVKATFGAAGVDDVSVAATTGVARGESGAPAAVKSGGRGA